MPSAVSHAYLGTPMKNPPLSGEWVDNANVHPITNVWGRVYMDKDGNIKTYYGLAGGINPRPKMWWFPND